VNKPRILQIVALLGMTFLTFAAMLFAVHLARAQDADANWPDIEKVVRFIDGQPYLTAQWLGENLSEEQWAAFVAWAFPPPSASAQASALEDARRCLERAGVDASASVVVDLEGRIEAAKAAAEAEAEGEMSPESVVRSP